MYWARRVLWLGTVGLLVAALLGTTSAGASTGDLKLIRVRESLLGTHYWYQQTYRGLPVLGGYYARHVDRKGREFLVQDGRRQVVALNSTVPLCSPLPGRNGGHQAREGSRQPRRSGGAPRGPGTPGLGRLRDLALLGPARPCECPLGHGPRGGEPDQGGHGDRGGYSIRTPW